MTDPMSAPVTAPPRSAPIRVEIWSDVACPWCYIGKRRFEAGRAALRESDPDLEVDVEYRSFELSPDTPVDFAGSEVDFLVRYKGIPAAQVGEMLDRVSGIAASVGLAYDFDALQHTNTVKAHELLHHAKAHGRQLDMKERLLRAYFVEGRAIGRANDLADLAADVGLDRSAALAALESGVYLEAVHADQQQAIEYGITGVPFFVVDGRYGISGAQDPAVFTRVLEQSR